MERIILISETQILNKIIVAGYNLLKSNELEEFKKSQLFKQLGFDNINLTEIDLKIIDYYFQISLEKNQILESLELTKSEIKNECQVTENELEDFINKLEPYILESRIAMGYQEYKLNYSLFWKTNYLENSYSHFIELIINFIDYLKNEGIFKYEMENEINIRNLVHEEFPFTNEHFNAILSYLLEINVITESRRNYNNEYILDCFFINNNFKIFIRKLES